MDKILYALISILYVMGSDFYTGIEPLDREITGGLPTGSLMFLKARPDTQSELLLQAFMKNKSAVYITSTRSEGSVKKSFKESEFLDEDSLPHVIKLDVENPLDEMIQKVDGLPDDCYVIFDSIDLLEVKDRVRYQKFLTALQHRMIRTESIAILHGYKYPQNQSPPDHRVLTEGMSDIIFNLDFKKEGGELVTELVISKFRGGRALQESIKVELTDTVQVDTSRVIG